MPKEKSTNPEPAEEPEGLTPAPMPEEPVSDPVLVIDAATAAAMAVEPPVSDPVLVLDAATAVTLAVVPPVVDSGMTAGSLDAPKDAVIDMETGESIRDSGIGFGSLPEEDAMVIPLPESSVIVPPKEAMTDAPKIFGELVPPEGPGSETAKQEVKVAPGEELVSLLISDDYTKLLWQRIDDNIVQINQRVQSLVTARELFDQVQSARNELLGGKGNYEEAERFINEVEFRIGQGDRVRKWSYTFGSILFLYQLAFAIVLISLLFTQLISGMQPDGNFIVYMGVSMVFGGLGGVVGAWFSLVKHIAQDQDFEWPHTMWYITSPLLGIFTGLVVVVISYVGLMSMIPNSDSGGLNIATPWAVYLLAFLTGYQHNVFIDLLKRALKVFEGQSKS